MLITEALDERDLLAKRIHDAINRKKFANYKQNNKDEIAEKSVDEEIKDITAKYQQAKDLIKRYDLINNKIIESNAKTMIKTAAGEMSVAQAIAIRERLKGETSFELELALKMQADYRDAEETVLRINANVKNNAQQMREAIAASEDKNKEGLDMVQAYEDSNSYSIVDPIGLIEEAAKIKEFYDNLLSEINSAIKVSNATTNIDV